MENKNMLQKLFGFNSHSMQVRTEILAGITTFLTMSYILAVNPSILGVTGMDKGGGIHRYRHSFLNSHSYYGGMGQTSVRACSRHGTKCFFRFHSLSGYG